MNVYINKSPCDPNFRNLSSASLEAPDRQSFTNGFRTRFQWKKRCASRLDSEHFLAKSVPENFTNASAELCPAVFSEIRVLAMATHLKNKVTRLAFFLGKTTLQILRMPPQVFRKSLGRFAQWYFMDAWYW